jgi:UDP-glucose 4-epimerase
MQRPDTQTRTYLVTGGAGFIGSHLADALLAEGNRVVALDDFSTGRMDNIAHLMDHPGFELVRGNITDEGVVDELASGADVLVHLAASVGVKLILEQPVRTIDNNVVGTETVLKAARRHEKKILIASTSEVYGKGRRIPFSEEDDVVLGATSKSRWAYAASKMMDEFYGLAYHQEYGLPVVPFRLFNTVGPRQTGHYGMVIPRLVNQALDNERITVYGDGTQRRCFCDVADAVRAIVGLAKHPDAPGKVYNVGSTEEVSIRELAERIKIMTGSFSEIVLVPYSKAYGDPGHEDMERRKPDTRRVNALLGWSPENALEDILERVISYVREQRSNAAVSRS